MLRIVQTRPDSVEGLQLMGSLSSLLKELTGSDGSATFKLSDFADPRSVFLVAYWNDQPVGCGGLRVQDQNTAEVKRLYSHRKGLGAELLRQLEAKAEALGFVDMVLATSTFNRHAIGFYLKQGYQATLPYGVYEDSSAHCCFHKPLAQPQSAVAG